MPTHMAVPLLEAGNETCRMHRSVRRRDWHIVRRIASRIQQVHLPVHKLDTWGTLPATEAWLLSRFRPHTCTQLSLTYLAADLQQAGVLHHTVPATMKRRAEQQPPFARLAVADELGLVKVIEVPAGPSWDTCNIVHVWGQPDKSRAVQALAAPNYLNPSATGHDILAIARQGGRTQLLDAQQGELLASFPPAKVTSTGATAGQQQGSCDVSSLAFRHAPDEPLSLLSCTTSGLLQVISSSSSSSGEPADSQGGNAHTGGWAVTNSCQTAPHVECMALDPAQGHVAMGGDGCQLQVWSLSTSQQVFTAKGAKPNTVGNVDLAHVTATTFLPDASGQLVMVGTAKHKLWLYDMRVGQRPQLDVSWGETRITSLAAQQGDPIRVWAANGTGHIEALDLKMRKMQGSLKGAAGSVRALQLHPDAEQPYLAVAGLDRFARIYSTSARHSQCKVYCKQQLTGMAWLRPPPAPTVQGDDSAAQQEGQHGQGGPEEMHPSGTHTASDSSTLKHSKAKKHKKK